VAAGGEVSNCSGEVLEKEGEYMATRQEAEDGMMLADCSPSGVAELR
jgi:hypothetical protein